MDDVPVCLWPLQPVFGTFSALRGTAWRRGVAAEPARSCRWPQSRHRLRTDHEQMLTFGQPSYFPPHQDNDKLECAFAPHQAKEAKHKLEANGPKHRPNSCLKTNAFSVASWDCWIAAFQDVSRCFKHMSDMSPWISRLKPDIPCCKPYPAPRPAK